MSAQQLIDGGVELAGDYEISRGFCHWVHTHCSPDAIHASRGSRLAAVTARLVIRRSSGPYLRESTECACRHVT